MSNRKELLDYIRAYCNQKFYGDAVAWVHDEDYEIGDIVVGDDRHTYKALTAHTSNNNPPPDNVTDWEYTEETLPGGVKLALSEMESYDGQGQPVKSESLGDYSVTHWDTLPSKVVSYLTPYREVGF